MISLREIDLQHSRHHSKTFSKHSDGKHNFLVDLDHDLTKSVSKALPWPLLHSQVWREGTDGAKIHEERSPNKSRVKLLEHRFGVTPTTVNPSASHLRAGSHRMSWITECGQARKHQIRNFFGSGECRDHSGHPGTSQPLTPQPPFWKATSQDLVDTEPIIQMLSLSVS